MLRTTRTTIHEMNLARRIPAPVDFGGKNSMPRYRAEEIRDWIRVGMPARGEWRWKATKIVTLDVYIAVLAKEAAMLQAEIDRAKELVRRGSATVEVRPGWNQ